MYTVNVDIFACIDFRGFMKMGNFVCIKIRVLCIIGSLGYIKVIFHVYIISRIFKKRELSRNMYSAKISTFTVVPEYSFVTKICCANSHFELN